MPNSNFKNRCIEVLKKRWREPFFGIAIGAMSALLLNLFQPLRPAIIDLAAHGIPKGLCHDATWPKRGSWLFGVASAAVAIALARPFLNWIARVLRSWKAGLISGVAVVFSISSLLCFAHPSGSWLFRPWIYAIAALTYAILTSMVSACNHGDLDRAATMRRLTLPRDQMEQMRSTVLDDDAFTSVLQDPNPVTKWSQDWIGRAAFVESVLQRVILDEEPVVAITGGFGEGKSSLLYLIKDSLRDCPGVISVMFNSFLPGDEQTLVASLLGSIMGAIRKSYIVPGLSQDFVRYGRTVAGVIPRVGEPLKQFFGKPSQADEVAELKLLLKRLPIRVVVLLDEIDRLQQDELMALLKLLRGVADLPRLRYVCAFNKPALADIVSASKTTDGNEYLEKFFPVELPLPKIDVESLRALFRIRLNVLLQKYSASAGEDLKSANEKWDQLWFTGGKQYFTTLRRLSIYFKNLEAVAQAIGKETNLFDLSVLELVRQVNALVFEFIYTHGKLFYFPSWSIPLWPERLSVNDEEERKGINDALKRFFSSLDSENRDISIQLLSAIFPNVASYTAGGGFKLGAPTRDQAQADRLKRIYHPDYFHRYFIYQVPSSLYGEQEMERFLNRVNEAELKGGVAKALNEELGILNKVPLRKSDFFDRLPEASRKLEPEKAELLSYCVAETSSSLNQVFLGMGEQGRARDLIFVAASRFITTHKAQALLEEVVRSAESDGFAADILFFSINQDRNKIIQGPEWRNIDTNRLQTVFADRMKRKYSASTDNPIPHDRGTLAAFFTWSKSSEDAQRDVAAYVRSRFKTGNEEVAAFIEWLFPLDVLYDSNPSALVSRLIPVEELQEAAAGLENRVHLTETQLKTLERFRDLCPPSGQTN